MFTKYCRGCTQERNIENFYWKNRNAGIRQSRCRFCASANSKSHYQKNKQSYLDRTHKRNDRIYEENIQFLHAYLSTHPCVDCGNNDIRVLEFDHIRGEKKADISRMVIDGYSEKTILAEIAK